MEDPKLGMETNEMCEIDEAVPRAMKKLRFNKSKTCAAVIIKIIVKEKKIVIDEEMEDCSVEELQEELPERQPRYAMYSYVYKHDDGRVSYPLCFIYYCPEGCNPVSTMLYAGSRNAVLAASGVTKLFEVREKETITEEWLREKLSFYR